MSETSTPIIKQRTTRYQRRSASARPPSARAASLQTTCGVPCAGVGERVADMGLARGALAAQPAQSRLAKRREGRARPRQVVALAVAHAQLLQARQIGARLDALGDDHGIDG